jgi:hypothetical protein
MSSTGAKGSHQTNKKTENDSNIESKSHPKCPLVWRTGLSGAPPDSVRCTRDSNSELLTFRNSGSQYVIIHRTVRCSTGQCPVCQRSNGYFSANGHLQLHSIRYSARRCQARARRRTGQSTGPVRCTTGLSGGPEDRSSNGQNPMAG